MPNKWVEHCRQFAKERGMKYSDALKHPDCKKGYGIFSKNQLTNIILHKNKVIEDLEQEAYKKKGGKGVIDELSNQSAIAVSYNDSELGANAGKKYISL
jgi:hypothetical protein